MTMKQRGALLGGIVGLALGLSVMAAIAPIVLSENGPTRAAVSGVAFGFVFIPVMFGLAFGGLGIMLGWVWEDLSATGRSTK